MGCLAAAHYPCAASIKNPMVQGYVLVFAWNEKNGRQTSTALYDVRERIIEIGIICIL